MGATYFTLYFLIDKFLVYKRYGAFLTFLIISMAVFGLWLRVLGWYVFYPMFHWDMTTIPLLFPPKVLICTVVIYSVVTPVAFIHFTAVLVYSSAGSATAVPDHGAVGKG